MTNHDSPTPRPDPQDVVDAALARDARAAEDARLPDALRASVLAASRAAMDQAAMDPTATDEQVATGSAATSATAPAPGRVLEMFARVAACAASIAALAFAWPQALRAAETVGETSVPLSTRLLGEPTWSAVPLEEQLLSAADAGLQAASGVDAFALAGVSAVLLIGGWLLWGRSERS